MVVAVMTGLVPGGNGRAPAVFLPGDGLVFGGTNARSGVVLTGLDDAKG
jgi:hypothetical protein